MLCFVGDSFDPLHGANPILRQFNSLISRDLDLAFYAKMSMNLVVVMTVDFTRQRVPGAREHGLD